MKNNTIQNSYSILQYFDNKIHKMRGRHWRSPPTPLPQLDFVLFCLRAAQLLITS